MLFHIHTIFDQSHCERVQFSVYDWKGILFCSCFVYFILLSSTALIWRKRNPKVGMRRGTDVTVICLTVRILPGEEGGTLLQFSHLPVDPKLLSRLLRFFFWFVFFLVLFCFTPHRLKVGDLVIHCVGQGLSFCCVSVYVPFFFQILSFTLSIVKNWGLHSSCRYSCT